MTGVHFNPQVRVGFTHPSTIYTRGSEKMKRIKKNPELPTVPEEQVLKSVLKVKIEQQDASSSAKLKKLMGNIDSFKQHLSGQNAEDKRQGVLLVELI